MRYFKEDLSAGLVVYLVALPLCLGIALASGAPLFAGLVSGIVAGVVVAWLSGSEISVSGPAAGLTIIVAEGISASGSFEVFLLAVVLAGMLQVVFGLLRTGSLAGLFPNSVISGMLAAIGIIILLKQIPHGLGRDMDYEGDLNFFQFFDQENTFTEIAKAVVTMHTGVLMITLTALVILIIWNTKTIKSMRFLKAIPGPLLVVVSGVAMNEAFKAYIPGLYINDAQNHMVNLPVLGSFGALLNELHFPVVDVARLPMILSLAITIAIIGSIESLLSVEAGDKIDIQRRISRPNKELVAQGVGNIICGLVGGLPITAVIVRTSANVYAGARTRFSVFVHGSLLLVSVLFIPQLLNRIPLASLAAILILVGYKLANASLFKSMYRQGIDQFLPFMVTMIVIIFSDLLTGVFSGLVVSMFFVVKANYHSAVTVVDSAGHFYIRFTKDVSFTNKVHLKSILSTVPDGAHVLIDGVGAIFIDRDIFDVIEDFRRGATYRGIVVETKNMATKTQGLFKKGVDGKRGAIQETVAGQ